MCIIFIAFKQHPKFPLIIAANRDENHDRPSQTMHFWHDYPMILAGRDQQKGGGWLGINQNGRFCAVTNFRTTKTRRSNLLSRGEWLQHYLANDISNAAFIDQLEQQQHHYAPFNLVFGNQHEIYFFCSETQQTIKLDNGIHSLSNGEPQQHWPKMSRGGEQLQQLMTQQTELPIDQLNAIMTDTTQAPDAELPNTGIGQALEKQISSIFVANPIYGTRATSYVFYSDSDISIDEINYDKQAMVVSQKHFQITLPQ